eukprot:m.11582 g.11582  ORF g.11582 m.11582 type:complete len:50 (+) comp9847_c0_seq1:788-937(+)
MAGFTTKATRLESIVLMLTCLSSLESALETSSVTSLQLRLAGSHYPVSL